MYKTVFANNKKVYVSSVYKLGFVLKLGKKITQRPLALDMLQQ